MSRKKSSRTSFHGLRRASHSEPALSTQELEKRWMSLRLQPQTKDHLEHILKVEGMELALAATIALSLEAKSEERKITRSLWDWMIEELRLLFLEEGCAHLTESLRLLIDASMTWTLVRGPALVAYLALPLVALGMFLISGYLICICRRYRASGHGA